jgi:PhnB protein
MAALKTEVTTEVVPYIFYRDVPAALDWLAKAFGFVETMREALPSGGMHGEMAVDGQLIMIGQGAKEKGMASVSETGTATQGVFIYLADVDGHLRAGARRGSRNRQAARRSPLRTQLHCARPGGASLVLHHASSPRLTRRRWPRPPSPA